MGLPLISKFKSPTPWLLGFVLTGLIATGVAASIVFRNARLKINLDELTVAVEQTDLSIEITASGTVVPVKSVNLSPKAAGLLTMLLVEQGDRVAANQIVAIMDGRDLDAQLLQSQGILAQAVARLAELEAGTRQEEIDQAETQVTQWQAEVVEAQSRLVLAQQRLERNQNLLEEGAISQDDFDAVRTEVNQAAASMEQTQARLAEAERRLEQLRNGPRQEEIAQAQAQVREAQGRLAAVQIQKEDTLIRAPFMGIITQRYAEPGAFVTPTTSASATASATSTSIVALAQGLEIVANVPEVDIGQIYLDQYVQIVADSYPDRVFQGQVRLIAPEAIREQNVTSFEVKVGLITGQAELRSGMNVDVTFLGDMLQNVTVVPTVAIVTLNGAEGILVPNSKNEPVFRPVTIGTTVGNQTQVLQGIQPEDKVFIELPRGKEFEEIKVEE